MGLLGYIKTSKKSKSYISPPEVGSPTQIPVGLDTFAEKPPTASRPASIRTTRSTHSAYLSEYRCDIMAGYIHQQQCGKMWTGNMVGEMEGVLVRKAQSQYAAYPPELSSSPLAAAATALNLPCVMTVCSRVIQTYLLCNPHATGLPLTNGLSVQILQSIEQLPRA